MRRHLSKKARLVVLAIFLVGFLLPMVANAGPKKAYQVMAGSSDRSVFIQELAPVAQELGKVYGIKPSILLGQAALETDYGRTLLVHRYKNLYATEAVAHADRVTLKVERTVKVKKNWVEVDYQVYPNYRASMIDYLERLKANHLGKEKLYQSLLVAKNYKEASTAFILGGYTTDSNYADDLVKVIEDNKLTKYDK